MIGSLFIHYNYSIDLINLINSYTNLLESYDLSFLHIPEGKGVSSV